MYVWFNFHGFGSDAWPSNFANYACMVFENIFIATSYNYTGHTYITGHACMHALQVIAIPCIRNYSLPWPVYEDY